MVEIGHRSAADYHAAGLAPPRSSHRQQRSPGCACLWCTPGPCDLCGLKHTNPNVTDGCLAHALWLGEQLPEPPNPAFAAKKRRSR